MSLGPWQIGLILVVVFIVFGAGKLPKVMGDVGKGIRSMKDGLKGEEEGESQAKESAAKKEKSEDKDA
jgi:sec-independent protein translocase protein TatA